MLFHHHPTIAVACLWVFLLTSLGAQTPPLESISLDCARCEATGEVPKPCGTCSEAGTFPCPACHLKAPKDVLGPPGEASKEIWRRVTGSFHAHWTKRRQTAATPGTVFCGWYCMDGNLGRREECSLCKGKGVLQCPVCPGEGVLPCRECRSKGTLAVSCPDCLGKKKVQVERTLDQDALTVCPFCRDQATPKCTICSGEGTRSVKCPRCRGQKKSPCLSCNARGKLHCAKCWGSGTSVVIQANGKDRCEDCKGKGHLKCPDCDGKKKRSCGTCTGNGRLPVACETCLEQGDRTCPGCAHGSFHAWEQTAQGLGAAGHADLGLQFLGTALTRCTSIHQERILELDMLPMGDDASLIEDRRKALKEQHLLDLKRLEALRVHLTEPLP